MLQRLVLLAQDPFEDFEFDEIEVPDIEGEVAAFLGVLGVVYLALGVLLIVALWKLFSKAGEPGWAAIIPIYNTIVWLKVAGKPWWWLILLLIPFVNFVIAIIVSIDLARRFGKGGAFAVGLIFLPVIFYPILGFGSARYQPQPA
jgi:hypothetical protein